MSMPRPRLTLAIAITTVTASFAVAAPPPDYLADPALPPGEYRVVNLGADRTAEHFFYRIPALAHLGGGVILAAWDARPGSAADSPNPNSIIQRRSTDNGESWGALQVIAQGQPGAERHGYSDPSYVVDRKTGRVFAFFVYSKDQGFGGSDWGHDDANRQIISAAVIHSDDQGLSWSAPRLITDIAKPTNGAQDQNRYTPLAGDVKGMFATSGEGIQLRYGAHAGRLLQPFAGLVRQAGGGMEIQAYSVYSDDHGVTWRRGEFVGTAMDENTIVELSDGRVMLNSRDSANGHARKVAISDDGGVSYGPVVRDAQLPDPTNNASLTRLYPDAAKGSAHARKLLFINANNGANDERINGSVRLSCDDGETWPGLRTLESGTFAYASATALDHGQIGVLWEAGYVNTIHFSRFDEAWLNAVCAPLTVPELDLQAAGATAVLVSVTNQEPVALSGRVTFFTSNGWIAGEASVTALAPGAKAAVPVTLTPPADAEGVHQLQAAFIAADGRVSQTTATLMLTPASNHKPHPPHGGHP